MKVFATPSKQRVLPHTRTRVPPTRGIAPVLSRTPLSRTSPSSIQRVAIRHILHSPSLQPKLTVGAPDDVYEREANRVADSVMRMPEPQGQIQRMCPECEQEMQRQPMEEDEEEVVQAQAHPGEVPRIGSDLEAPIRAMRGGGRPLPDSARAFFEPRFGQDLSGVRVHDDARAAETARAVHARAFTLGQDVVFGKGEYSPQSEGGRHLLAHELTHVVQQSEDTGR